MEGQDEIRVGCHVVVGKGLILFFLREREREVYGGVCESAVLWCREREREEVHSIKRSGCSP